MSSVPNISTSTSGQSENSGWMAQRNCEVCQMSPIKVPKARQHQASVEEIDAPSSPELTQRYQVLTVPTTVVLAAAASGSVRASQACFTSQKVPSVMCSVAPACVAGSPEFIELICAQSGNERTGQLCHGSRLPQFQPAVDTLQVAHPLRAEAPPGRIEEDEAQHRRVADVALLLGLQPLGEARARQADHVQLAEQRVVIGADVLVDLDLVVLDGDAVPACLGVLLH